MAWNLYELRIEILREFARVSQLYRVKRYIEFVGRLDFVRAPVFGRGYSLGAKTINAGRRRTLLSWEHDIRRQRQKVRKRNEAWLRKLRVGRSSELEARHEQNNKVISHGDRQRPR